MTALGPHYDAILEVLRTLTLPLLPDSLQSVSSIKRMRMSLQ